MKKFFLSVSLLLGFVATEVVFMPVCLVQAAQREAAGKPSRPRDREGIAGATARINSYLLAGLRGVFWFPVNGFCTMWQRVRNRVEELAADEAFPAPGSVIPAPVPRSVPITPVAGIIDPAITRQPIVLVVFLNAVCRYVGTGYPTGMPNIYNSCFLNATLQALFSLRCDGEMQSCPPYIEERVNDALSGIRTAAAVHNPNAFPAARNADASEFLTFLQSQLPQIRACFGDAVWPLTLPSARAGSIVNLLIRNYQGQLRMPQALAISLTRFVNMVDARGRFVATKNTMAIPIPETLDFANGFLPACLQDGVDGALYRLKAVVIHHGSGSADHGHYTALVRRNYVQDGVQQHGWFMCNDDRITPLGADYPAALTNGIVGGDGTPYVMFYEKDLVAVPAMAAPAC